MVGGRAVTGDGPGDLRREPDDEWRGPERGGDRGAVAGRVRASGGFGAAVSLLQARCEDGQPELHQAVREGEAVRDLPADRGGGAIEAGDSIEVVERPAHGVTIGEFAEAYLGDRDGLERILAAEQLLRLGGVPGSSKRRRAGAWPPCQAVIALVSEMASATPAPRADESDAARPGPGDPGALCPARRRRSDRRRSGAYARKWTAKTPAQTKKKTLWKKTSWSDLWPRATSRMPVTKMPIVVMDEHGCEQAERKKRRPLLPVGGGIQVVTGEAVAGAGELEEDRRYQDEADEHVDGQQPAHLQQRDPSAASSRVRTTAIEIVRFVALGAAQPLLQLESAAAVLWQRADSTDPMVARGAQARLETGQRLLPLAGGG